MTQLYLISPPSIDLPVFSKALEAALAVGEGFVTSFQLRLKEADDATIRNATRELMPIVRAHGAAFIINDRPDICAELKCDGVHVGQEDLHNSPLEGESQSASTAPRDAVGGELPHTPHGLASGKALASPAPPQGGSYAIKNIRNIIGADAVIGVTCHASKHLAMEAGEQGADYVAFGAFYPTTSKPREKLEKWGAPTPEILSWWQSYMTLPCVAIGGITPGNCKPLAESGADFIAVITAVWNHPKGAAAAVKEFKKELQDEN